MTSADWWATGGTISGLIALALAGVAAWWLICDYRRDQADAAVDATEYRFELDIHVDVRISKPVTPEALATARKMLIQRLGLVRGIEAFNDIVDAITADEARGLDRDIARLTSGGGAA